MSHEGSPSKRGKRNAFLAVAELPDDEDLFVTPDVRNYETQPADM